MKLKTHAKKITVLFSGLLVVGFIVVVFIVSNKFEESKNSVSLTTTVGPLSQSEYQHEAQRAVADYELFLEEKISIESVTTRKQHLLELKISKEFQSLHLQLVTIADALLAFNQGQAQKKDQAKQLLSEIYVQYPWLKK